MSGAASAGSGSSGHGRRATGHGSVGRLSTTVLVLGVASFLTDLSSEMIFPLLPVFLTTVLAAGPRALGVIEGFAESTASLLKVASGIWTDRTRRRKPLVVLGYSLSGAVRPLIALATAWPVVLALRVGDRIGKGTRTSPRDALIADVTPSDLRGRAYGLHRAFDHAGAVAGPLVAAALLQWGGLSIRQVFLLAAVPAALVILVLALGVREPASPPPAPAASAGAPAGRLGRSYRRLLLAIVVFTLGNSTDAFLLLRLGEAGLAPALVAAVWSALHVVKSGATYLGGRLSDRLGRRPMVIAGWLVYAIVYLAFAVVADTAALVATFLFYGVHFGLTEPVEKAWVAELAPAAMRGRAFGWYHGAIGFAALPASLLFGLLWQAFGSAVAFATGAALALVASGLLLRVPGSPRERLDTGTEAA
jgi:MFS family permease